MRRIHDYNLHADVAYRVVVCASRSPRDDDLGLVETGQVGNPDELLGVTTGHAGCGYVLESGGATSRNHSPLSPGQLGEPASDGIRQFVQLNIVPGSGIHRSPNLR